MQKTRFDLREVVRNAADIYSHLAAEAGLRFVLAVNMEDAMPVFSNPDRVEQGLIVLLDNAIKHTPDGGTVTLLADEKAGSVDIRVSNTGEGIPSEDLPYIFERFYKVDKSHSGGGTGLGLSIAHEIMKELDESVRIESEAAETIFIMTVHKGTGK
jgi:signal transduction histidine kinase